jgi:hypothetical protein
MRYRVRRMGHETVSQDHIVTTWTSPPTSLQTYTLQNTKFRRLRTAWMEDLVGNIAGDFNPCYHWKLYRALIPPERFSVQSGSYVVYYESSKGFLPADFAQALLTPNIDLTQVLDDFSVKAEHHAVTAVDDTHSIANFLIEIIQMCEGNVKKLQELGEKLKAAIIIFKRMYEKTGDYWLSWNFAIKPMFRDIVAIRDSLKTAKKRLDWLRKRNHLDTKVKYRENFKEFEVQITNIPVQWVSTNPLLPPLPAEVYFEIDCVYKMRPSSWAWVRFDIPDYLLSDDGLALGGVWAAIAGLWNPAKVIWEAVPFSWLIDWFLSRRSQAVLELANLSPFKDAQLLAIGHSLLFLVEGDVYLVSESTNERQPAGKIRMNLYVRRSGLPNVDQTFFTIPGTWYQFSIIGALFMQNIKRRRGRSRR